MPSELSENLVELAAEQLDPAKWAAFQLVKGGRQAKTVGEAMDLVEQVFREALEMERRLERKDASVKLRTAAADAVAKWRAWRESEKIFGPEYDPFSNAMRMLEGTIASLFTE